MAKTLAEARGHLRLSKLESQTELLSTDLDLSELKLITRNVPEMRIEEAVTAANISRTIEGASTVDLTLNDRYGYIKNSGRLGNKVDIKIDGLWFRLVKVQKTGFELTLSFESREVAILRTYMKFRASKWGELTRTRFVQVLVQEVKEFRIPFICPELKETPKEKATEHNKAVERHTGFGNWKQAIDRAMSQGKPITIKGSPPTSEQLRNIETVLDVGSQLKLRRKLLVCAIMTGIVEQSCYNHRSGDADSVGFFQQRPSQGWGTQDQCMDLIHSSKQFYSHAANVNNSHPDMKYGVLCQTVQNSGHPERYALHGLEADRIVRAYGVVGSADELLPEDLNAANNMSLGAQAAGIDQFQFMRGRPKDRTKPKDPREKEDSWTCMQRLADEVDWRCFEVSGSIYFISEPRLFKSAPRARISEESEGIDWIDYDYDIGQKNAQVSVTARLDRWVAPPGSILEIDGHGVSNGRWIVSDISRSLFDSKATVTLKKPRPVLPEPQRSDVATLSVIGGVNRDKRKKFNKDPGTPLPGVPTDLPHGKALRQAVLNNKSIRFTNPLQTNDIEFGLIKPNLLRFMLAFVEAGFDITVTALRSDHSLKTTSGNISLHSKGLAVDMGNFTKDTPVSTNHAQQWVLDNRVPLQIDELIGPNEHILWGGPYDQGTLLQHKNHIHVGVFP